MFNIVMNIQYLLAKNVIYTKLCVYYSEAGTREPINYSHMPNNQGNQKFDHPCP